MNIPPGFGPDPQREVEAVRYPVPATRNEILDDTAWRRLKDEAQMFIEAGCLPTNITKPQQAMVIILKGRELGIPPMASLSSVFLIKGTPAISAQLMLGLCYRDVPGFQYEIQENSEKKAKVRMRRNPNAKWEEFEFTIDEAKAAGLPFVSQRGESTNWTKYPKRMLLHRAVSFGCRSVCPDAVLGSYTPEEAEEIPDRDVTPPEPAKVTPPDYLPGIEPKVTAETYVSNLQGVPGGLEVIAAQIIQYVNRGQDKYASQIREAYTKLGIKFEEKKEPPIPEAELLPFEKDSK